MQPPTCLLLALHLSWRQEAGREMLAVWCGAECRQGKEEELRRQVSSSQVCPSQLLEFFPSWYMPFCSGNPAPSLLKCDFSSSLYTCVRTYTHTRICCVYYSRDSGRTVDHFLGVQRVCLLSVFNIMLSE